MKNVKDLFTMEEEKFWLSRISTKLNQEKRVKVILENRGRLKMIPPTSNKH